MSNIEPQQAAELAAAVGGQTTADAISVLAGVLSRRDQRAQQVAEYVNRSHAAGLACEHSFNVLGKGSVITAETDVKAQYQVAKMGLPLFSLLDQANTS